MKMKQPSSLPTPNKRQATVLRASAPSSFAPPGPAVDDIAKGAYLNYMSQGSQPGHDVQHWLAAEAQLLAQLDQSNTG